MSSCQPFVTFAIARKPFEIDRGLVPKDHQQDMAYSESNGHVTMTSNS